MQKMDCQAIGYGYIIILHSYRSWSAIFHWPTSRTYRFIQQLKTNGIIEIIPHNDTTALHIRVVNYENWTNISALLNEKKENTQKASNEKFRLFWDDYHNILQLPKENIAKAQRIWKKLSEKEQQLAIDHIEEYYYHQTNMKFTLHACSYLSNKAFLNEYEY